MHVVALCLMAVAVTAADTEAVVLEFTAPDRCPPCQQIAPLVHRLQREGFPLQIINADENAFVCQQHRVISIPTFVLMIAGREVERLEGKPSEGELRRMCDQARSANTNATPKPEARTSKPEIGRSTADEVTRPADTPIIRAKQSDAETSPKPTSNDPLKACLRIRVKDSQGINFGTGTIVDSREGRTTILTCGHIFRKIDDKPLIEVDIFNGTKHETTLAHVMRYDLERDVGLIWIPTSRPLPVAPIAGLSNATAVGEHVFSIGCSAGDPPTKLQHRVTCLNRYNGPDNIECTGVPVQGRSGGGLFDTSGRLIGVCIAADQRDQRGLYSGLQPIHDLLGEAKLSHLLLQGKPRPNADALAANATGPSKSISTLPTQSEEPVFDGEESPTEELSGPFASSHGLSESVDSLDRPKLAAAALGIPVTPGINDPEAESDFDPKTESEVVCIIRPLNNPRGASRVVIINRASSKFLSQLSGELAQQAKPTTAVAREAKYATTSSITATPRQFRRVR
ncbi:MAG: hypothetical protein FJ302_19995 [Planctomycetes bacterium]|nr:hypothetical protein [Planctomycetota bacterium]